MPDEVVFFNTTFIMFGLVGLLLVLAVLFLIAVVIFSRSVRDSLRLQTELHQLNEQARTDQTSLLPPGLSARYRHIQESREVEAPVLPIRTAS